MTEILDRMLGLSAVTHATFTRQRFDMRELAVEVCNELSAMEPDKPADFEVAELPPADADRKLVKTLLINLVGNAIKYTRTREQPRIRVSSEAQDGVDVYCVSDNGIGFDSRHSKRLFAAFERLGQDQTTEGTGLGLAIVARVVERHGAASGRTACRRASFVLLYIGAAAAGG
jgi:signal transduction histidine kinase